MTDEEFEQMKAAEDELYAGGRAAGRAWALRGNISALRRFHRQWSLSPRLDRGQIEAEEAFDVLFPKGHPGSLSADEFWEEALDGDDLRESADNPNLIAAFVAGALDVWDEYVERKGEPALT